MAIPAIYTWPIQDLQAIVKNTQLGTGIRIFTFNGNLAGNPGTAITLNGISRTISLKSASNLSGLNFTISGVTGSGGQVTINETIAGPNNNTVYTTNTFNIITSITVNADMTGPIDIGTGLTGYTNWFYYDIHQNYPALGIQTAVTANVTYTFQTTCDDASGLANSSITIQQPITAMTGATTSLYAALVNNPIFFCRMAITSSNTTGVLVATIIQQGTF